MPRITTHPAPTFNDNLASLRGRVGQGGGHYAVLSGNCYSAALARNYNTCGVSL